MADNPVDLKSLMPTERKSMWRTAEERRMSDLTRVLEWMERRWGKKKRALQQKAKEEALAKANKKEEKKGKSSQKVKHQGEGHKVSFQNQNSGQGSSRSKETSKYNRMYNFEHLGKHLSISGSFTRDSHRKSDLDIKDAIALESAPRPMAFRRQSMAIDPMVQDSMFGNRRVTLMRDWASKTPDSTYERKLRSLMEKNTEPKMENVKMLKPEEVLSCRYLRLSKNNIRTLLKLCKDAGLDVDIHPHMVEAEIDSKKVFARQQRIAL